MVGALNKTVQVPVADWSGIARLPWDAHYGRAYGYYVIKRKRKRRYQFVNCQGGKTRNRNTRRIRTVHTLESRMGPLFHVQSLPRDIALAVLFSYTPSFSFDARENDSRRGAFWWASEGAHGPCAPGVSEWPFLSAFLPSPQTSSPSQDPPHRTDKAPLLHHRTALIPLHILYLSKALFRFRTLLPPDDD